MKHFYCNNCGACIENSGVEVCSNVNCGQSVTDKGYFIEIPITEQIKNLFSQDGFHTNLQGRFKRQKNCTEYRDIYDGVLYKSHFDNDGPLSSPDNLSFVFNTDGAPVFKSSNYSIWPLFLSINELPYKLRTQKQNMILAGLWFSNKKPLMGTFLKPLLNAMKEFESGILCKSPERGEFKCKAYILCGTADLPARSLLCNMVQYNGSFSCIKCEQKGITAKVGKGHAHIFPYQEENPKEPKRTKESILQNAKDAIQDNTVIKGIKGPSWLMLMPRFDIAKGTSIDYMHGVLLGVQRLLLRLWFSKDFSKRKFSMTKHVKEVDSRLLNIKPSSAISRLPRSIETSLKYWKASEYRSFLLYYGAVVLRGILDDIMLEHYLKFVEAMHILLKNGSMDRDITNAENMLCCFVKDFSSLYSESFMTLNVHQLLHLADSVRQLGPLYTHSCFTFENQNAVLLKMIKSSQNVNEQIVGALSLIQKMPELQNNCKMSNECEMVFESLTKNQYVKLEKKIATGIYRLGVVKERVLSVEEMSIMNEFVTIPFDTVACFERISFHGQLIYSVEYKRLVKRNNAAVHMFCQKHIFGFVRFFAETEKDVLVVCDELEIDALDQEDRFSTLIRARKSGKLVCAFVGDIVETLIAIRCSDDINDIFLRRLPNTLECD